MVQPYYKLAEEEEARQDYLSAVKSITTRLTIHWSEEYDEASSGSQIVEFRDDGLSRKMVGAENKNCW